MKIHAAPRCFYCGALATYGLTHPRCRRKGGIDGYSTLYKYEGLFKKVLHEAKYSGARKVLEELLIEPTPSLHPPLQKWKDLYSPVVTAVPLHPNRERERGFNQSTTIAMRIFPRDLWKHGRLLQRTIDTAHLANIREKAERRRHIKGSFAPIPPPSREAVLLIDDVSTSGSTLVECARALKKQGAKAVLAFSLAKG